MTLDYGIEWKNPKEELPPSENLNLCYYKNRLGKDRYIIGMWIPKFTVECDCECDNDWNDYLEEKDLFFTPEGWYENVEADTNYGSYFADSQDILAWCPIPKAPEKNNSEESECRECELPKSVCECL